MRPCVLFGAELIQQIHHEDDNAGDNENTQIADAHDGQGFHQKIYTHDISLQS